MKIRVLIVDDEKDIADGIEFLLKDQYDDCEIVGKACDGLEGYDMGMNLQPDVIITDIKMPNCDGLDMVHDIFASDFFPEIIILSGYAEFEYAKKAMELGVKYFVTKPIDEEELYRIIDEMKIALEKRNQYVECLDIVPEELLLKVEEAIDKMDNEGCSNSVSEIFRIFRRHRELNIEDMQMLSVNLASYGIRKIPLAKMKMNHYLGKNIFSMQSVAKLKSLDQLQNWVINVLTGVNDILMHDSFSRKKDVVDEAKEYMRQNLEKNISLNEISEKFFVNPYYFSQLFKKKTGTNYQKYLTSLRVERAQKLLKETNLKIYEIAQMVGYADVTYFSKLFERTTGVKPSEFRGQNE